VEECALVAAASSNEITVGEVSDIMKKLVFALECRHPGHPAAVRAKEFLKRHGLI
jgi:hypothetical protein